MARSLWSGAVLSALALVSGLLWGLLGALRDVGGSQGAKGVFLTVAVLWIVNFIALVVLTALCQLTGQEDGSAPGDHAES